jgi:hypothetical protein
VFIECDWFDSINSTEWMIFVWWRWSTNRYSDNNLLFVYQTQHVYYLSYTHESMKHWWVLYKVNPEMNIHWYDAYVERHDDDDVVHVYQEENEGHQSLSFIVSDGARLRINHTWCRVNGRRTRSFKEMPSEIKMTRWKTRKAWVTHCTCC